MTPEENIFLGMYDMKFGEYRSNYLNETIILVAGGWIYKAVITDSVSVCFIPFNNDFQISI